MLDNPYDLPHCRCLPGFDHRAELTESKGLQPSATGDTVMIVRSVTAGQTSAVYVNPAISFDEPIRVPAGANILSGACMPTRLSEARSGTQNPGVRHPCTLRVLKSAKTARAEVFLRAGPGGRVKRHRPREFSVAPWRTIDSTITPVGEAAVPA